MSAALKLAPAPYRNVTGGLGVDRFGACMLNTLRAAEAAYQASENGDGWRCVDWGDGLAATGSTLGVHGFTSNGGLGYVTAAAAWGPSVGGANSFSNALAWFCLGEFVGGVATGRQRTYHRGFSTAPGGERFFNIMKTTTPCTGVATPTAPRSVGGNQQFVFGTAFGAGGDPFCTTGSSWIASSTQLCWSAWVAERAVNGCVALGQAIWGSQLGTYEATDFDLPLSDAAASDDHPFFCFTGLWAATFGGTTSYMTTPGLVGTASNAAWCVDMGGVWRNGAVSYIGAADTFRPNNTGAILLPDADGDFWLLPAYITFDNMGTGTQAQLKGLVIDAYKIAWVTNSTHRFPTTIHSSVAHATEPARWLMGPFAVPGEVGVSPNWPSATNQTTWKSLGDEAVEVPEASDETSPVVTLVSPASGRISKSSTVVLDVTDDVELGPYLLLVEFDSTQPAEVLRLSTYPRLKTLYNVSVADISGGHRLTFTRTGGWPKSPRFYITAVDTSGNQT